MTSLLVKEEVEREGRSLIYLRLDTNLTLESVDDEFADIKAKTNSFGVHSLSGRLDGSKELEHFLLVLLLDAHASVLHLNLNAIVVELGANHLD